MQFPRKRRGRPPGNPSAGRPGAAKSAAVARLAASAQEFVCARAALIALAVFAAVGVSVLGDYGVTSDDPYQRSLGEHTIDYVLGGTEELWQEGGHDVYYGVAFEVLLVAVERVLGLEDTRSIQLGRQLSIHLTFLAGGFCLYLLVRRMFGDRILAFLVMLMFLLHPRLYAHSFFNSKDIPFLSLFTACLLLLHRAFAKNSVGAFLLCGAGVGLLANVRIFGVILVPVVLAMRACDFACASDSDERKRVLATAGAFTLAGALVFYATFPTLWANPLRLFEGLAVLSRHPTRVFSLLLGEGVRWPDIPAYYIPVWVSVTTPPAVLVLALIGAACAIAAAAGRPGDVFRNGPTRFEVLAVACLAAPVAATILLNSNIYNGWRHVYFLYAPLCLLAAVGLRRLASPSGAVWMRRGVLFAVVVSLGFTAVETVRIHPWQMVYFNALVDRTTPERLRTRFDMEYWGTPYAAAMKCLLDRFPGMEIAVNLGDHFVATNANLLSPSDRLRLGLSRETGPGDFFISHYRAGGWAKRLSWTPFGPEICAERVYRSSVFSAHVVDLSLVDAATAAPYREAYRQAVSGEPEIRSEWDVYVDDEALIWVKEPCVPNDTRGIFLYKAFWKAPPPDRRLGDEPEDGSSSGNFIFDAYGVRFDGKCLIRTALPDFDVERITVGQWGRGVERAWESEFVVPGGPAG